MKTKRILSGILLILGIGLYIFGSYISGEVAEGRKKIASGQQSVDRAKGASQFSPYTKGLGDMATGSAQKKIDKGKEDVEKYQAMANWLHGVGIVVFIVGAGLLIFSFTRKKNT